jgi:Flp pilus assembly protein protease CpaA
MPIEMLLLVLVLPVSLYDLRTGRVPNGVTLPILAAGLLVNFPGSASLWLISLILYSAWQSGWMAAGDAKLWLAVLWLLPDSAPHMVFLVFFATGLLQIILRRLKGQPLTGIRSPGAWRTIPFLLWSLYAH